MRNLDFATADPKELAQGVVAGQIQLDEIPSINREAVKGEIANLEETAKAEPKAEKAAKAPKGKKGK